MASYKQLRDRLKRVSLWNLLLLKENAGKRTRNATKSSDNLDAGHKASIYISRPLYYSLIKDGARAHKTVHLYYPIHQMDNVEAPKNV